MNVKLVTRKSDGITVVQGKADGQKGKAVTLGEFKLRRAAEGYVELKGYHRVKSWSETSSATS